MSIFSAGPKTKDRLTKLEVELTQLLQQRTLPFDDLDARLTKLERTLSDIVEAVDARIERGNQIWRQIRARERRAESLDDESDESDPGQGVFDFDGAGSQPEEMQGMSPYLATSGTPLQPHEEVARAIAAQKAGKGVM